MKRKLLLLAVLAAIAAAAVVGGLAATAFGPEGSTPYKPSGRETRVRIEPQEDRVACSSDKQAVDIFLDDLGRSAGPGLAAFELTLLYDPAILRVERRDDAQMNPALASAQTAGGMRGFIPGPTTIDNLEGYVILGAVGIPQGEPWDPSVAGPDPVARGEAILLFTVNFQTVGEGTSALTVSRPEEGPQKPWTMEAKFLDWGGREFTPLVIEDASLTVTAGDCAPASAVTPRPTQALPKWWATPTPGTPTPVVVPTPQVVTPVPAAEAGRTDCPEGRGAYVDADGHFSLCYPAGMEVITRASTRPEVSGASLNIWTQAAGADYASTKSINVSDNGFYIALGWHVHPAYNLSLDLAQLCPHSPLLIHQESSVPVKMQIGGRTAVGCFATGLSDSGLPPRVEALHVVIPVSSSGGPEKGYVSLLVDYMGPDLAAAEAAARAVIDTLVIPDK
jgi:hypothetical protein